MIFDRKTHRLCIHIAKRREDILLCEYLQSEFRMILRRSIVERPIAGILPKPSNIVKESDDLSNSHIVRMASKMLGKCAGMCRHIAGMNLLELNAAHDLGVIGTKGAHIGIHPCVHFMQEFFHLRSSFHVHRPDHPSSGGT